MKNLRAIKRFINDCFLMYDIEPNLHFYDFDDNDRVVHFPIFNDSEVEPKTIAKLSQILGLNEESILNTDRKAMKKIHNKYAYFKLKEEWELFLATAHYKEGHQMDALILAIFDTEDKFARPWKFDVKKVNERLISELKTVSKIMPEMFHKGAEIKNFRFTTETFATFHSIKEFVNAYIEVFDRISYLFFTSLERDLNKEEINEYNLFVSHFMIKDVLSNDYLYYPALCNMRKIYKAEGYLELFSYIKMQRTIEPWHCKEFVSNRELVEAFLNKFPDARIDMRKFLKEVMFFDCSFNWSDVKEPTPDCTNESEDIHDINFDLDSLDNEISEYLEYHKSYLLQKNDDELGSDLDAAMSLKKLLSAPKLGGIKIKFPKEYDIWYKRSSGRTFAEFDPQKETEKMISRSNNRKAILGGGE